MSKHGKFFAKGYAPNRSEEVFMIKKVKNTVLWTYVIEDLNAGKIVGTLYGKELQKTNQSLNLKFKVENVIKRKSDKLYVKWKGYDNLFNSWIDKKEIVI